MTDLTNNQDKGTDDMDDVGRLIKRAGAREQVDDGRLENARVRVADHWSNVVAKRQSGKRAYRLRLVSLAAAITVAVGISFVFLQSPPPLAEMATVERVLGDGTNVAGGDSLVEGAVIETTASGRVALAMAGGQSLRIDRDSRLIVHSANRVSLEKGAIYIDTAFAADPQPIQVATPMGTAWDVGTQFQVRLDAAVLIVGVRDGLVEVATNDQQSLSVNKGRYLELALSGQHSERPIENDDPSWDWVRTIVPDFDIEGVSLKEYLAWYANENGLELSFADATSEQKAGNVRLSGSIGGASLEEGLQIVRQIAPFEYNIDGNSLWVRID